MCVCVSVCVCLRESNCDCEGELDIIKQSHIYRQFIIHKTNKYNDNLTVIKSKTGQLVFDEASFGLNIVLNDGYRYEEILTEGTNNKEFKPHTTIKFKKHTIVFDLKTFYEVDFSQEKYNNTFRMQNIKQLKFSVDSLEIKLAQQYNNFSESFYKLSLIHI